MNKVGELVQGGKSVGEKHSRVLNHVGVARHRRRSPLGNGNTAKIAQLVRALNC